ncbi:hypothetical protein [Bacillus sp. FJAT-42376]|uniref:hypothetical protein n=1 Tax=Bacillus sp. FJAT-42376 TaxID=2014076 RepID=UPI000F4E99A7|nr:hypothetical protein [Bacillus sp. FJAT-42376]
MATVQINGEWYDAAGNDNPENYTPGKELGKVKDQVSAANSKPNGNFESNYLKAGTSLFSFNEDENVILAEIENGSYKNFEKRYKKKKK